MSHLPRDIHRRLETNCACFPGTCRGGEVIDGKTANGQRCKATIPVAIDVPTYAEQVRDLAKISGAELLTAEHAFKKVERNFDDALTVLHTWGYTGPEPIDMVLHCPVCGAQHVDKAVPCDSAQCEQGCANPGDCIAWPNLPHRSHLCRECGHIWRPADVPTNGVESIKTKGKKDSPLPAAKGVGRAKEKNPTNSLYVQGFDAEGKQVVLHARTSRNPVEDHRIMTSALELAQAITLRDVRISEVDFYDLVVYGKKGTRKGTPDGTLRIDDLHHLIGYVQDGSSQTLTIGQDDATKDYIVKWGRKALYGKYLPALLLEAIEKEKQS